MGVMALGCGANGNGGVTDGNVDASGVDASIDGSDEKKDASSVSALCGNGIIDNGEVCDDAGDPGPLCDGTSELRLAVYSKAHVFSLADYFYSTLAYEFLLVMGDCRYYVRSSPDSSLGGVHTGLLATRQAEQLADAVGWGKLDRWKTFADNESCADAGGIYLQSATARVVCTCGCGNDALEGLEEAFREGFSAVDRLWQAGSEIEGGAVTVAAYLPPPGIAWSPDTQPVLEWPLSWDFATIVLPPEEISKTRSGKRIDDPEQVAELRKLRDNTRQAAVFGTSIKVRGNDGEVYALLVRDELPATDLQRADTWLGAVSNF